jgi:hypothetical protein
METKLWALDHDHETNRARGVLCQPCNLGLHYIETPGWLSKALAYLSTGGVIPVPIVRRRRRNAS